NGGYLDAYGNEWKKGPSRTDGQHFEWDVVPRSKDSGFASFSRDGSHVNVSLDGSITHR
ncbi:MAG: adhesin, partial [Candidatus Eremiobacteraeota bacterium]|nr:adhesin [Candidatus Eremiobacteraeota bacterium]